MLPGTQTSEGVHPLDDDKHEGRRWIGRRLLVFDQLESTNTFALALAGDTGYDGLVVIAREQTAGRGQYDRQWSCPQGAGVLMSVLVFPPSPLRRPAILTAWAAVSVCRLIQQSTGLEATIKWPNDVLIADHKVCGILIEQARGVVVGIGLNVNQTAEDFVAAGLPQAASLGMFAPPLAPPFTGGQGGVQSLNCANLGHQLVVELDSAYEQLQAGNVLGLQDRWQSRLDLVGNHVEVTTASSIHRGQLLELTFDQVAIQLADNTTVRMTPETVRRLEKVSDQGTDSSSLQCRNSAAASSRFNA